MQSQNNVDVRDRKVVQFFSASKPPFNVLSNFNECHIVIDGVEYPSSEHAFLAQQVPNEYRHFYSTSGPFGSLSVESFRLFFPRQTDDQLKKKVEWWSRKDNVGILAKWLQSLPTYSSITTSQKEY